MINAIATVSLSGSLEDKLNAAAQAGFDGVEIFENDLIGSLLRPREVRALLDDLGLRCLLYQPFRDFEGMPGAMRQRAFDRAEAKFDLMGELGTDRILVCSNCSPHALGERNRIVSDLHELGERAAHHGIVIGYEALAWGRYVFDHRDAWAIVEAVNHPAVGIILDSFHSLSRNIPSDSIRAIPGHKIAFVQLADAPRLDMNLLYWSRHFRNFPGQGNLAVADYVAEILRTGYDGPLSLEIFNDRFRGWSAGPVAIDGLLSLRHIRDLAARQLTRPSPIPPPPATVEAAFVEFVVAPVDALRLETMFATMGFVRTATHRSLAVSRWQNGSVNLIINSEDQGFAGSYRTVHGTAISAIGILVPDGNAVAARAVALGLKMFASEQGSENLDVPAVWGIGGSLVYLIDRDDIESVWAQAFVPTGQRAPSNDINFDHLAAVVTADEFLSWQLFWRSLFGLVESSQQDVIDPSGLVLSQALQSADGAFRVTINASDATGTLSARFVAGGIGGGFQHLAFSTDDLTATAADWQTRDADLLPIPENYYDDLGARFPLENRLEPLRNVGILYDEDEHGHYLQLYTRAFDRRFFFEVVERVGYRGYGAPNAGVRLAAQRRFQKPI